MESGSDLEQLLSRLRLVRDPRKERGRRHSLVDVLFIALVAMLCGADDAEAMESFEALLLPGQTLEHVHYFTARIRSNGNNVASVRRQALYLDTLNPSTIHYGHFLVK